MFVFGNVGDENPLFFVFHDGSGLEEWRGGCSRRWRREDEHGRGVGALGGDQELLQANKGYFQGWKTLRVQTSPKKGRLPGRLPGRIENPGSAD